MNEMFNPAFGEGEKWQKKDNIYYIYMLTYMC